MNLFTLILIILIPELIIGFFIGLQVIKSQHQSIVWKTINRGQDVSDKISNNDLLTLIVLTAIGIFSILVYSIAKRSYLTNGK